MESIMMVARTVPVGRSRCSSSAWSMSAQKRASSWVRTSRRYTSTCPCRSTRSAVLRSISRAMSWMQAATGSPSSNKPASSAGMGRGDTIRRVVVAGLMRIRPPSLGT